MKTIALLGILAVLGTMFVACGDKQEPITSATPEAKPELAVSKPTVDGPAIEAFKDFERSFLEKTEGGSLGKIAHRVLDVENDSISYRYYVTEPELSDLLKATGAKLDTIVEMSTTMTVQLLIEHAKAKGLKVKELRFMCNFITKDTGASGEPRLLHAGYSSYSQTTDSVVYKRQVGVWKE